MTALNTYRRWLARVEDDALRAELSALDEVRDAAQIEDRFYRDLAFGTGGLRGVLGAGTNRMNVYVVRRATQGLAAYLKAAGLPLRCAIAYDSRIGSARFARETARVLAGRIELAVADAGDDTGLRAVADEAGGPTGGSHVGEGSAAHEGVSSLGAELEVRDDLRGLLTGQVFLGIEIALFIANEHANGVHDVNSFLVVDLVGIFESCVADGDEGHGHDQRQHQSE